MEKPPLASEKRLDALVKYSWPGNVRELEHLDSATHDIHRRLHRFRSRTLAVELENRIRETPARRSRTADEGQWLSLIRAHLTSYQGQRASEELLEKVERLLIVEALRRSQGNQTHAARLLGMPRPTLHARMQKYGLL